MTSTSKSGEDPLCNPNVLFAGPDVPPLSSPHCSIVSFVWLGSAFSGGSHIIATAESLVRLGLLRRSGSSSRHSGSDSDPSQTDLPIGYNIVRSTARCTSGNNLLSASIMVTVKVGLQCILLPCAAFQTTLATCEAVWLVPKRRWLPRRYA